MPVAFRCSKATLLTVAAACVVSANVKSAVATELRAAEVTIYTVRSIVISAPANVKVAYLDAATAAEEALSSQLPHDPARAVAVARQRLLDGGESLKRNLASAYEDIAEAWSLGITTLPAVVVDRRYVIYGEPDVARALTKIEAFRRAQP